MNAEEIRAALQDVSPETLADALALVFAEGKAPSQQVAGMDKPNLANFAQAILYLKKNYGFEELDHFSTEADLVYVNAGERRVLLTDRTAAAPPANIALGNDGNNSSQTREDTAPDSNGGRFSNLEI